MCSYVINGVEDEDEKGEEEEETRQTLHIAYVFYLIREELWIDELIHRYHSWEHYSSVRNIDGPYSGPPEIKVQMKLWCRSDLY